jgi:hypothetical protein
LDDWLAKGDDGEGEESDEELAYQAQGHKWGRAVNPEYEVVRSDRDGDGLSDAWEEINGRDPEDGKLRFTFDCGGWQTEGWQAGKALGNIAGRQGFLDFELAESPARLRREGLQLAAAKNSGPIIVSMRSNRPLRVELMATVRDDSEPRSIGVAELSPAQEITQCELASDSQLSGGDIITALQLVFTGEQGTWVEIDSISAN